MLDEYIERWSGYTLIGIGLAAIAVSAAGYFYLLPPPFSMRPEPAHVFMIGPARWTFASQMFGLCGLLCIIWGRGINAYFRRDWRAENTTSHLTSAEALKGTANRMRLRRKP